MEHVQQKNIRAFDTMVYFVRAW